MGTVNFTRMEDGSREDYLLLEKLEKVHTAGTADRVLEQLIKLKDFGSCYWARLGGFSGSILEDTLANGSAQGPRYVDIGLSDVGFETQCIWIRFQGNHNCVARVAVYLLSWMELHVRPISA